MKIFFLLFLFILFSNNLEAHVFSGMIGFYDGVSHPVLGADHFLAMISVGIISAQIGGRAIWSIPSIFVLIMMVGGLIGGVSEIRLDLNFINFLYLSIEMGILFSVIFLGLSIAIEKKLPVSATMIIVGLFGFFHGLAHGLEMPQAANPILFALGFILGTSALHMFGVIIGYFSIQNKISSIFLRIIGFGFACFGFYSLILFL